MQVYLSGLPNGNPEEWCHTHHLLNSELNRIRQWDMIYLPSSSEDTWNITAEFCAQYADVWPVEHEGGIIILKKAYEPVDLQRLHEKLPSVPHIVVSEPFSDLKLLINHLHACRRTVDLAQFDGSEKPIVFVANYKMPIAYLVLQRMPNGMSLYHPAFDLIHEYDRKNETQYFETLKVYLLNEMSYPKTEKKLFIHKNTAIYRIRRIEELFRLNLKDCRVITALYLSFFEDYRRSDR